MKDFDKLAALTTVAGQMLTGLVLSRQNRAGIVEPNSAAISLFGRQFSGVMPGEPAYLLLHAKDKKRTKKAAK